MKKLNIASGKMVLKGWDNLDIHSRYGANIIWDLNKIPLPIKDESYNYILASFILEHFNDCLSQLREWFRILRKGGKLEIIVPYGDLVYDSIDHKRVFYLVTFMDFLIEGDFENDFLNNITLEHYNFYTRQTKLWPRIKISLFNFLIKIHPKIIDYTFLRFFCKGVSLRIIYKKS